MKGLNPGQPILIAKGLGRRFGDRQILKGASFSLMPGDRVGVLGVNGVGKSTLMKILAGRDAEYEGDFHIAFLTDSIANHIIPTAIKITPAIEQAASLANDTVTFCLIRGTQLTYQLFHFGIRGDNIGKNRNKR